MQSVLVVDDHMEIRLIFSRYLRDAGYVVYTAKDGKDALAAVDQHRPDLVLLDVFMPVMNGAQFLEQLRQSPLHQGTPVVLLSAVPDSPEAEYARSLGVSKFLRKGDFNLDELGAAVKHVLSPAAQ